MASDIDQVDDPQEEIDEEEPVEVDDDSEIDADEDVDADDDTDAEPADKAEKEVSPEDAFIAALGVQMKLPKNTASPEKEAKAEEKEAAAAEYLSKEDWDTLDSELGAAPTAIIKKLVSVLGDKDKEIQNLKGFRGDIEKIGQTLGPLSRVAAREQASFEKDVNTALDSIAKEGGAKFLGSDKSDRKANLATYEPHITALLQEAHAAQQLAEQHGVEKTLGECAVLVWNQWQGKQTTATKQEPTKKEVDMKAAKAAMVKAAKTQARRAGPELRRPGATVQAPGVRSSRSPDPDAMKIIRQYVKGNSAAR